jgi:predicted nucleotidyltransferase
MKSKNEILDLLRKYKPTAKSKYGVTRIGIFGSIARNEHNDKSDIDVVYEGEPNILFRSRIKSDLEALFGCRVDVVRYRKQLADTIFGKEIQKDLIMV